MPPSSTLQKPRPARGQNRSCYRVLNCRSTPRSTLEAFAVQQGLQEGHACRRDYWDWLSCHNGTCFSDFAVHRVPTPRVGAQIDSMSPFHTLSLRVYTSVTTLPIRTITHAYPCFQCSQFQSHLGVIPPVPAASPHLEF